MARKKEVITKTIVEKKNTNPKSKKKNSKTKKRTIGSRHLSGTKLSQQSQYFAYAMLYPDLAGPVQVPRVSGADRSVLGADYTYYYLGTTSKISLFVPRTLYNDGYNYAAIAYDATSASSGFSLNVNVPYGTQYPQKDQVSECNLVSLCLTVSYLAAPLSATGEIIFGVIPNTADVSACTFNSLMYFPGVVRIPLAALINNPLRIPLIKYGTASQEYVDVNTTLSDCGLPFVCIAGFQGPEPCCVQLTRNWEIHASIKNGSVIPYSEQNVAYEKDVAAYQDACAFIGSLTNAATTLLDDHLVMNDLERLGNPTAKAVSNSMQSLIGGNVSIIGSNVFSAHRVRFGGGMGHSVSKS